LVREMTAGWPGRPVLINPAVDLDGADKRAAFRAADVALAASGTVSLELAASETPMVIAYDMNWITRKIAQRMLKIDVATLVSLVSETRVIPEFIGEKCQPGPIAEAVLRVLENPGEQVDAMRIAMDRLGKGGEAPGLRAARSVLSALRR
jgi:lipid-A-disaccharide synthase